MPKSTNTIETFAGATLSVKFISPLFKGKNKPMIYFSAEEG